MGTLYLVATPIGNLEDVTLRALRVLSEVVLVAVEDTRRARKLLDRYEITIPTLSYFEHNKLERLDEVLAALDAGDVALLSDAGTPGLSDPGYELVRAAWKAGHQVSPLPGASAPIAALVASGLPSDRFLFIGYLPRAKSERLDRLGDLAAETATLIAFEAPHRLVESLQDLAAVFGPERPVAVCRELTKLHEEIVRGTLSEAVEHFSASEPRGEFTLVIGGASAAEKWDEAEVRRAVLRRLEQGMNPSRAAKEIASEAGWPRREVYRMTLEDG